ncbi:D-lactaldehyde dehydrogenase [Naematelia encephala]|uniref:D-lactaldehyde dehydrogenase n=1 Tax=Naematelia encephala TaxID=71784 RepID=A0A1Y2BLK1_9TREE|nr:D-lactaldehyde dehydrogenase [Naematelia encephala]
MPAIQKGAYVLVTGASGFIASHTVREFLREGFRVRGTVRSQGKGEYLQKLFAKDGPFDFVLVDDITKDGVFDEAVKGVDAVAHLASPFYTTGVKDPQELIGPAVKGTTGILKSIQKNNPQVKRVVITSSVASIMSLASRKAPVRYTEKDWNEDAVKHVEENGLKSQGGFAYQASKTLAEKALWKFIEDEKPSWDAVAINPPYVLGDVIHECEKPEKLNTSVASFYEWAAGQKKEEDTASQLGNWANVHNVAYAHVKALTVPEASGGRFIVSSGPLAGQAFCDILHSKYPELKNVPVGKPGTSDDINKDANVFVGDHAAKVLGVKYESLEQTVVEMVESFKERKWL